MLTQEGSIYEFYVKRNKCRDSESQELCSGVMFIACIDDLEHILQPDAIVMRFVEARSDSEEVALFEHIFVLGGVGDVDRSWGERRDEERNQVTHSDEI